MAEAVRVDGLDAHAGEAAIVSQVGFEVHAGEIVTLFGPSGAGKTTIAAAVAGIDVPGVTITGDVLVNGRVGYLPQHAAGTLNPARRIGRALGELIDLRHPASRGRSSNRAKCRAERRARVRRVLALAAFEIDDAQLDRTLRKYPFEFSGGQRTRLALAQVLATEPSVLVLDEPTVGLDSIGRATLTEQLETLREHGIAVLLVTHDHAVATRLSDRALHIRNGRLVTTGEEGAAASRPPRRSVPARTEDRVVELRNVHVTHDRAPILHGVDLTVSRGETLGIVGVSGAGKSTIAHCVTGLLKPTSGSVLVNDEPVPALRKQSRDRLARVQYIWQEAAVSFEPRRTVLDQVATTGVRLRGVTAGRARPEALATLAAMGVEEGQALRYPAGLSGGQLQRAALARALLARPEILVCDEVTTGLDSGLSSTILDYVESYRYQAAASVISISHDLRTQLGRADRIAVVENGRVVEEGTPADLVKAPQTAALRALLAAERIGIGDEPVGLRRANTVVPL